MEVYDHITAREFLKDVKRIEGYKVSKVCLGYANALFLECGRLKTEVIKTSKSTTKLVYGQITFLLDCNWRVERKKSIEFGMQCGDRKIENRIKGLKGTRIVSISTTHRIPELCITLDDGRVISTFTDHITYPAWSIGFKDLHCIEIDPEWKSNDVSVWLSYDKGGFRKGYCFDENKFSDPEYLKKYYGLDIKSKAGSK